MTVLFADLKSSMELRTDRNPEEAHQLLDPVLERIMAAVHRYERTVNMAGHAAQLTRLAEAHLLGSSP